MAYAASQDLVDRFGELEIIQLTDRETIPPAAINADVAARALADADALIDGYLLKAYALPLQSTPPALVKIACDIARFNLWGDRADPKGAIRAAYDDALRWLGNVSKGVIKLEVDGAQAPAATTGDARFSGSEPVFSRDSLRGTL
jgi:phage gp36-like protein